ncbi:MAG TPA: efflux RND transporter periplasmic adaptor subunit [Verrucomicrobiae bacterium]|jgi:RND family efflux transporter MFP subunit|nr:efflux RND transporter periplasmic adaptor subunit [Verrucomicrobiae bacterium]
MNTNQTTTPVPGPATSKPAAPPPAQIKLGRFAIVAVILIVIGLAAGLVPRWFSRRALARETVENATQSVAVVSPSPGKSDMGVPLPAEVQAFVEAPIYARANGYLKRWDVDIGEHVEAGQLLAEIDTPEVDEQLEQAKAEVAQADANLALAKSTSERWADLLKTSSVSEQETAEKQADFALKKADLEAAHANLHRLEDLKSFARVTAPFAGTITARDTDLGQLIAAGNARALFRLAQTNPLRVYVHVPQTLSRAIEVGQGAELLISELPGRKFDAKVVRTAGAMDPSSRTLLTELQVNNPKNEILSGSYAQVRFDDTLGDPSLTLPANTMLFRSEGMQVGVVNSSGKVEMRTVKIGRDFGETLEIVGGVKPGDRVIVNPPDSLASGTTVRVAAPTNVAEK